MRKGLGSKRNELGPDDIAAIVKLYEVGRGDERSKVFAVEDFFYRTITVERPLRLNWALTPERFAVARETKALVKVDWDKFPEAVERSTIAPVADVSEFRRELVTRLAEAGLALTAPQLKALVAALAERDDAAPVIRNAAKRPEPDPTLRDTENVTWSEDIHAYFAREVRPFAPDAWIDESKTKEGCEIPFTRHFYKYVPPRSLDEIDEDLEAVLGRIRARLEAVRR
jgi:type I restriction enzyme M protein